MKAVSKTRKCEVIIDNTADQRAFNTYFLLVEHKTCSVRFQSENGEAIIFNPTENSFFALGVTLSLHIAITFVTF